MHHASGIHVLVLHAVQRLVVESRRAGPESLVSCHPTSNWQVCQPTQIPGKQVPMRSICNEDDP